ncbi:MULTISPECIES: MFS transporter [Enterobacteriaceae]|uniref:MFS transporter n=1 Tax=Enterobacteriaceae TaxID=543 RepID=UPI000237D267|nr:MULTISPECIES: MFS transporter [Enterobacteriaceae]QNE50928.1 MFS transporter [Klebsiella michiganensis]
MSRDNSLVTPRVRNARMATFTGFMLIGAMMYIWSTSVSAFRSSMGLDGAQGDVDFGMIALGIGVGAAVGSIAIGKFIDIFGPKKVVTFTVVLYPVSMIALAYVTHYWFAFAICISLGLLRGATDTALNAHGVQVERFYQRSIMSAFHASYSLGGFLFGMLGSYLVGLYPQSATVSFTVCGVILLAISIFISRFLLDKSEMLVDEAPKPITAKNISSNSSSNTAIIILMTGFGLLLLCSMIGENAISDWGQEYLRREVDTSVSTAGFAISLFIGAQFVGRIFGDFIAEKIGAIKVVFLCGIFSVSGLMLVSFASQSFFAIIGYSLFGLGLSCIAPLMLSNAGRKDPANAGRNIGIVNGIGYTGMLVSPAILSFVVHQFGLSNLFVFPLGLLIILTIFSPLVMRVKSADKIENNPARSTISG